MYGWLLLLSLFGFGKPEDIPRPAAAWQVPFVPSTALVDADGHALLFDDGQMTGYSYDAEGVLQESFTLPRPVDQAFTGPDGAVLVHLDGTILARLNEGGGLRWQRSLPPPAVPPSVYGDYLVYTDRGTVALIDPTDGQARFSLRHTETVVSVQIADGWIWVSDSAGTTLAWEPLTERKEVRLENRALLLHYITRSPVGDLALVSDDGALELLRADGKQLWHRRFYIDAAAPPVFLSDGRRQRLLLATKGRNLLCMGAARGELQARRLLAGRPTSLVAAGPEYALVTADQIPELLWFHGPDARFRVEKLDSIILAVADNASYLLLVAENGIIRLYRK